MPVGPVLDPSEDQPPGPKLLREWVPARGRLGEPKKFMIRYRSRCKSRLECVVLVVTNATLSCPTDLTDNAQGPGAKHRDGSR